MIAEDVRDGLKLEERELAPAPTDVIRTAVNST
jgi:hypothetical protein